MIQARKGLNLPIPWLFNGTVSNAEAVQLLVKSDDHER